MVWNNNGQDSDGKVAPDMESKDRLRRSRGISEPAVQNRIGGMPSESGLWNGLAYFINVMMPATSNKMEINLAKVSAGWILDCGRWSLMRADYYVLNVSAMSTGVLYLR